MKKYKKLKIYKYLDDMEMMKNIIESGGNINRIYKKTGENALFLALDTSISIEVMIFLLEAGVDVNAQNKLGDSVVHVCHDLDRLKLLIDHGANVNLVNKASLTPIFGCVDVNRAALLVEHGADLNVKDDKGQHFLKSLHVSNFDLMKIFIDKGMNRFIERNGLTLDAFFEKWSTIEVQAYFENKLRTQPELYRVKV